MIKTKHLLALLSSSLFLSACTLGPTNNTQTPSNAGTQNQSLSSSLRELMAKGGSLQCKYEVTNPDTKVQTKATMYISGEKFAQDVEIIDPSTKTPTITKSSVISDGTGMYTWNPGNKDAGMKFPINKTAEDKSKGGNSVDLDKKTDMNCSPWNYDQSKFNVPTDIKFTDLSELMKTVPTVPKNIPTIPAD